MFYDNYVRLCNDVNRSPSAVAEDIGLSRASVNGWKRGKIPTDATLKKVADYFGVAPTWLLTGKTDIKNTATNKGDGNNKIPSNLIPYRPTGTIPILGQIPAGLAMLAVEDIEGYTSVDVPNPEECFALRVKGDSMINAGICPNDLVIIRYQNYAENGQIVACRVNGEEATLKRFKKQGDSVILLPENPNYDPIVVNCSDFDSGYAGVIGVAIGMQRSFL